MPGAFGRHHTTRCRGAARADVEGAAWTRSPGTRQPPFHPAQAPQVTHTPGTCGGRRRMVLEGNAGPPWRRLACATPRTATAAQGPRHGLPTIPRAPSANCTSRHKADTRQITAASLHPCCLSISKGGLPASLWQHTRWCCCTRHDVCSITYHVITYDKLQHSSTCCCTSQAASLPQPLLPRTDLASMCACTLLPAVAGASSSGLPPPRTSTLIT